MNTSNRKNYIIVLCAAGHDPRLAEEKDLIYRECWLSTSEAEQLALQIKACKGLSGYRMKKGPDTIKTQKGPGDLPRILAKFNGGETPRGPSQRSIFEALYFGRMIHEGLPEDDAPRPARSQSLLTAGLLAATALVAPYAKDRAPWPNALVPQLGT